jgi:formylglycine-generating enzyme required for sulfatase activity
MRVTILALLVACRSSSDEPKPWTAEDEARWQKEHEIDDDVVEVPDGEFWGPRLSCPNHVTTPQHKEELYRSIRRLVTRQSEFAFRIHRRPVSCKHYDACVRARRCDESTLGPQSNGCSRGFAVVTQHEANQYCTWRGGHLPTYAQWNKAVLGAHTEEHAKAALARTVPLCAVYERDFMEGYPVTFPRCEQTSPYGVIYAHHNPNFGEWTGDTECLQEPPAPPEPVLVDLIEARYGVIARVTWGGEFRCTW